MLVKITILFPLTKNVEKSDKNTKYVHFQREQDRIMQPQILLLKDGTESAGGKQQVISNINACQAIVDAVRTTLGPRGMDKLIVDPRV